MAGQSRSRMERVRCRYRTINSSLRESQTLGRVGSQWSKGIKIFGMGMGQQLFSVAEWQAFLRG